MKPGLLNTRRSRSTLFPSAPTRQQLSMHALLRPALMMVVAMVLAGAVSDAQTTAAALATPAAASASAAPQAAVPPPPPPAPAPPTAVPQTPPPPPPPPPAPAAPAAPAPAAAVRAPNAADTALQIQVVIARFQGEKRLSSLPYTVSLRVPGTGSVRMNAEVPVSSGVTTNYRAVGTNIDINAMPATEGRYALTIAVEDSSVYTDPADAAGPRSERPVFRSFRANNTVYVRNGETSQFTAATDRVSGEVTRVEVSIRVMK